MTFYKTDLVAFKPSLDEILIDMNISSPEEIDSALLTRCASLYASAKEKKMIFNYTTLKEFILCNSSDFFQTVIGGDYKTPSFTFFEDFNAEPYFLLFKDKLPEPFRVIVAAHEYLEYALIRNFELNQEKAHYIASVEELAVAELNGLKSKYISFLAKQYSKKFDEIIEWDLI